MAARIFLAFCLIGILNGAGAQENPASKYRMHLKLTGNVPHPVSNKAFRRSFIGVYDMALTYRLSLFGNFSAGVQGAHSLWRIPDNKIPGLHTVGQFNGGGVSIGYDHVIGEVAVVYGEVNAGMMQVSYFGVSYDSMPDNFQTKYNINYGEAEFGAYFYTEGSFAIGMQTSFMFTNYGFDPYKLALDNHKAYFDGDTNGNVVAFKIGFSVIYSFLDKKGP
jgi:hypothetical protein